MRIFEDVTLEWDGKKYVVPSNKIMGAIARVESILTLKELTEFRETPGNAQFAKLSMAYGAFLRYAGARVTDEEVYKKIFGTSTMIQVVFEAIDGLLMLMIPSSVILEREASGGTAEGKSVPTEAKSSQEPIAPRSGAGGSDPTSSGDSIPESSGGSRSTTSQ